jgi:3'-phosphoadenosine 5'-phosphosulfate (PAPS) 3'-phosphatase
MALLETLMGVALAAGKEAFASRPREAKRRAHPDPAAMLSPADRARRLILEALGEIAPRASVVAADDPLFQDPPGSPSDDVLLASALEGATRDLGSDPKRADIGDLTISLAVVRGGAPVMGVVYAPGRERLWAGFGETALRLETPQFSAGGDRAIRIRALPQGGMTAVSGGGFDPLVDGLGAAEVLAAPPAIAFCLTAEGSADLASIPARTAAWNAAAGDAILRAAGGRTLTLDGDLLVYRWPDGHGATRFALPALAAVGSARLPAPAGV